MIFKVFDFFSFPDRRGGVSWFDETAPRQCHMTCPWHTTCRVDVPVPSQIAHTIHLDHTHTLIGWSREIWYPGMSKLPAELKAQAGSYMCKNATLSLDYLVVTKKAKSIGLESITASTSSYSTT